MKKIIFLLLVLLIPFLVQAEKCNPNKITIEYLGIGEKNNGTFEKSSPIIEGDKIKIDIGMSKDGDFISYKFKIKNESNSDYEIDNSNIMAESAYHFSPTGECID